MRAKDFIDKKIPFADGYLVVSKHFIKDRSDGSERNIPIEKVLRVLHKLETRRSPELMKMPYISFAVKTNDLGVAMAKQKDYHGENAYIVLTAHPTLYTNPEEDIFYLEEDWKNWLAGATLGAAALAPQTADAKSTTLQPKSAVTAKAQEPINLISMKDTEAEKILHRAALKAGIKGTELAQFLAQARHESDDFSRMKEFGGAKYFNKLYDPKTSPKTAKILGNTHIGDGVRYHGRGFIQITGRDNYRMAGKALGIPLEQQPELAARPDVAAKIAVWYWQTRVKPYINNFNDTKAVTQKINPAMRGLQDRHAKFIDYKNIL